MFTGVNYIWLVLQETYVQFLCIFLFVSITFIVFKKEQISYFGTVKRKLFHVFLKWISCHKWSQGIFTLLFFIFNFEINFSTLRDIILSLSPASDTITVSEQRVSILWLSLKIGTKPKSYVNNSYMLLFQGYYSGKIHEESSRWGQACYGSYMHLERHQSWQNPWPNRYREKDWGFLGSCQKTPWWHSISAVTSWVRQGQYSSSLHEHHKKKLYSKSRFCSRKDKKCFHSSRRPVQMGHSNGFIW